MAVSGYEQIREQRIKENMERMQKLGLFDLSSKLNSAISSCKKPRTFQKRSSPSSPLHSSLPPRRSSRLENKTPVSYYENSEENKLATRTKGVRPVKNCGEPCVEPGSRPEIYTEEHEKLLGSCESAWDLSIDDGRRVYDQVKGKTCHQCRQKTLGHRTCCIQCNPSVQGQFCGDCLYIRYGENVLEANQNPNWICPPCRGICNCSLCRHANGWLPTGAIHRKVVNLGYKSVAHYLIQTRRAETLTESDEVVATDEAVSIKRSLPFADTKEEGLVIMSEVAKQFSGHKEDDDDLQVDDGKQVTPKPVDDEITLDCIWRRLTQSKNIKCDSSEGKKDEPTGPDNKSEVVLEVGLGTVGQKRKRGKSGVANEPNFESIGRRLRQRRDNDNENIEDEEVIPNNQLLKEIALVNFRREVLKGGGQKKMPQWMTQMNTPRFTREDREPLINLLPKGGRLGRKKH
ncbi:hypothetical protein ACHQM5_018953 [Ranunculus cassubicifolius]